MDPMTTAFLKAVGIGGPLGVVLGLAVLYFARKVEAKERCKDPDAKPCGVCFLCRDRAFAKERTGWMEALKAQEAAHAAEIEVERGRVDALQDEQKQTLKAMIEALEAKDP